jgi:LysM repeat protein
VWRSVVALIGSVLVAAAGAVPAAAAAATDPTVRLSVEANTGSVTSVLVPSAATLDCDDDVRGTGFLRNVPKPACALARKGTVTAIAKAHRNARICREGYGGPQRATISGTIGGRRVAFSIDRTDGCGIDEWNQMQALLGDPERRGAIPRPKASTATTTTTAPPATYVVQRGDTLTEIAKQFHTSVGAIVSTNTVENPDDLTEGQRLTMPPSSAVRIDAEMVDEGGDRGVGLTLLGAEPSELVTFLITLPDGSTYTGSPHSASIYGVVTTTYTADLVNGVYRVTGTGERGTNAETAFHLDVPD